MKKFTALLILLFSLAVLSCSDSGKDSDDYTSGIIDYDTFLSVKNTWKEPTSYSYTVHLDVWKPNSYVIDVKVTNGESTFSLNPTYEYYSRDDTPESVSKHIESCGWNVKTMTDFFASIEKKNASLAADPSYRNVFKYYFIGINYDKCNNSVFPCYVQPLCELKDSRLIGDNDDTVKITDFKILEE